MYTIGNGALPSASAFYILDDLGGGISTASWGVSFYLVGNLITKPLALCLGDRIGKIKLVKICLWSNFFLLILFNWVQSYYAYLLLRFLVGLTSGPVFLIATSVVAPYRKDKLSRYLLIVMSLLVAFPVITASFGAIMAYQGLWRWAFNGYCLFLTGLLVSLYRRFKTWETPLKNEPIDWWGFIFFGLMSLCLAFCLITGQTIDGFRSKAFNLIFISGLFFAGLFFTWNARHPRPIFANYLFKNSRFNFLMLCTFLLFGLFYSSVILVAFWLHLYANYSLNWIALSLIVVVIGPVFVLLSYKKEGVFKNAIYLSFAILLLSLVSFYTSTFNSEVNFIRIIIAKVLLGFSLAFAFPPLIYLIKQTCTDRGFPPAFCLFAIFRMGGSCLGVAYFIMLWERRASFYYQRLGGELTYSSSLTREKLKELAEFGFSRIQQWAGVNTALIRQSQSLALDDCFRFIGWISLGLALITAFAPKLFKNLLELR